MELVAFNNCELLGYEQELIQKKFREYYRLKTLLNDKVLAEILKGGEESRPLADFLPRRFDQVTATAQVYYNVLRCLEEVKKEWERRANAVE